MIVFFFEPIVYKKGFILKQQLFHYFLFTEAY